MVKLKTLFMQVEECSIQLQLNQLLDDCEGAIKWAESYEEIDEIIKMYERQANQLLTQ